MNISVITDPAKGGTFLSWSLYFLTGNHTYDFLQDVTNKRIDLPKNPIKKYNAHKFLSNQIRTTEDLINIQNNLNCDSFNVLYAHQDTRISFETVLDYLNKISDKIVIIKNNNPLYDVNYHSRARPYDFQIMNDKKTLKHVSQEDSNESFFKYYFKESIDKFNGINLKTNDIWDIREFISLTYNPYNNDRIDILEAIDSDYYLIDFFELINQFDSSIENLLTYLDCSIDNFLLKQWNTIYNDWKKIHISRYNYSIYFDHIIDAVLNGYNINLTRFNLDIYQEAMILRELMVKHNLSIKGYGVEKFVSTKQLHSLLEPNIHNINKS